MAKQTEAEYWDEDADRLNRMSQAAIDSGLAIQLDEEEVENYSAGQPRDGQGRFGSGGGGGAKLAPDTGGGDGGGGGTVSKGRFPMAGESPAEDRLLLNLSRYDNFEDVSSDRMKTPGKLFHEQTRRANAIAEHFGGESQDYELRAVDLKSVKPSQKGEDYLNSSSKALAKKLEKVSTYRGKERDELNRAFDSHRMEDLNPIATDPGGKILDGNHRHAAHAINGEKKILALVPVGKGTGKITNFKEVYEAAKGKKPTKNFDATENYSAGQPRDSQGRFGSGGGGGGAKLAPDTGGGSGGGAATKKAKKGSSVDKDIDNFYDEINEGISNDPEDDAYELGVKHGEEGVNDEDVQRMTDGDYGEEYHEGLTEGREGAEDLIDVGELDRPDVEEAHRRPYAEGEDLNDRYHGNRVKVLDKADQDLDALTREVDSLADSIEFYTEDGYDDVNYQLRRGKKGTTPSKSQQQMIDDLDKATALELEEPIVTFRGCGTNSGQRLLSKAENVLASGKEGYLVDKAFTSTSADADIANSFDSGSGVVIQVLAKRGAYVDNYSSSAGELELILPRKSKLRVDGIDRKVTAGILGDSVTVIRVTQL